MTSHEAVKAMRNSNSSQINTRIYMVRLGLIIGYDWFHHWETNVVKSRALLQSSYKLVSDNWCVPISFSSIQMQCFSRYNGEKLKSPSYDTVSNETTVQSPHSDRKLGKFEAVLASLVQLDPSNPSSLQQL